MVKEKEEEVKPAKITQLDKLPLKPTTEEAEPTKEPVVTTQEEKIEEIEKPKTPKQKKETKKRKIKRYANPLLFGLYDFSEVKVTVDGLNKYINIEPIIVPHSCGRYSNKPFGKTNMNIVERLINGLMRTEHATGEKARAYTTVKKAFAIIHEKTKQNPIQVLVDAIQNASPIEEVTRLRYGGISVPKAVDTSSARRVYMALRYISIGTIKTSRGNKKRIEECLANELILASKGDMASFAVSKKEEISRVAASAW